MTGLADHLVDAAGNPAIGGPRHQAGVRRQPQRLVLLVGEVNAGESKCGGRTAPAGSFMVFTTHLVGVDADGSPVDLGIKFHWRSNFNGKKGGVDILKGQGTRPHPGTGGVTILSVQPTTTYTYNGVRVTSINDVPTKPPAPTRSAIKALLIREIAPGPTARKIGTLTRRNKFSLSFQALAAGSIRIQWRSSPTRSHPKAVIVAAGHAVFTDAATTVIAVKLTKAGSALLASSSGLALTAKGTFVPHLPPSTPGANLPISATKTFKLTR